MAMDSMYAMIMSLPLFKGISREQVSSFLEKTNLAFRTYHKGEVVFRPGDVCRDVRYLIGGNLELRHTCFSGRCIVVETLAAGSVIGVDRLFGLNTRFESRAECQGMVDMMWFSKEQFLQLLHSDEIYLINFLNYLSLRAQKPVDILNRFKSPRLIGYLAYWISILTERGSTGIEIEVTLDNLSLLTGISIKDLSLELVEIRQSGLGSYSKSTSRFRVESRQGLMDAYEELDE